MNRRHVLKGIGASALIPSAASALHPTAPHSFPPEWAEHEAVWMGWTDGVTNDEGRTKLWLEMINALSAHVRVKMIVKSGVVAGHVRELMTKSNIPEDAVQFVVQPTTDVWLRDSGPLFVSNGETLQLADFEWRNYGFPYPLSDSGGMARRTIDHEISAQFGYPRRSSRIIAEGGGIDVNSHTMVSYKDAAQLRNPGETIDVIEAEFKRLYGKRQVIWLDRAPISDRVFDGPKIANFFGWGANGHVDEYVRFVREDTILVAQVSEEEKELNPLYRLDHEILEENMQQLKAARDVNGKPFNIIPVPMPDVTALMEVRELTEKDFVDPETGMDMRSVYRDFKIGDKINWLPASSYLNFLVTNGVVLVAKYGVEGRAEHLKNTDEEIRKILQKQYPDREIVQLDPLAINWGGGGMHCITQQEPKVTV